MSFKKYYMITVYFISMICLFSCKDKSTNPDDVNGQTRVDSWGVEQIWVAPGTFLIGSSDSDIAAVKNKKPPQWVANVLPYEQPQHEVELKKGYWIDKYEVTNAAYQKFVKDSGYYKLQYWSEAGRNWLNKQDPAKLPSDTGDEAADKPRVNITWYEAEAYASWRNASLPTEAEWEYSARGPQSLIYPYGNNFDETKGNVINSKGLTKVGNFPKGASWIGVQDMSGNAMEWVKDWLGADYYKLKERVDPQGPASGTIKIEKGGWWGSNQFVARCAYKHFEDPPTYRDHHIGFRVVSR